MSAQESPLSNAPELSGIALALGIERVAWKAGSSSVAVDVEQRHCNKGGVAHGGLYTMMLDMALGGALVAGLRKEEWCATTQLTVSFIDAARVGERITATGEVVRRGRNVAHLKGQILSQSGRVIATAVGTWAVWEKRPSSLPQRTANELLSSLIGNWNGAGTWAFMGGVQRTSELSVSVVDSNDGEYPVSEEMPALEISEEVYGEDGEVVHKDTVHLYRNETKDLLARFDNQGTITTCMVEEGVQSLRFIPPAGAEVPVWTYRQSDGGFTMQLHFKHENGIGSGTADIEFGYTRGD